jgi:hypothetical protein
MEDSCDLCAENVNEKNKITCHYDTCKKISCKECYNKILLENSINPVCVWCKKVISFRFIVENIKAKDLKIFMDKRSDTFLEREKSQLPYLQEEAEFMIKEKKFVKRYIEVKKILHSIHFNFREVKKELRNLFFNLYKEEYLKIVSCFAPIDSYAIDYYMKMKRIEDSCYICDNNYGEKIICECKKYVCVKCYEVLKIIKKKCFYCENEYSEPLSKKRKTIKNAEEILNTIKKKIELNLQYYNIISELYSIKYGKDYDGTRPEVFMEEKSRSQFIKKCPDKECRGYLSTRWKCGICSFYFCVDCHRKKEETHECNEDEKATIQLLKKESKPCPKCEMPISRIDGCSQVWTPCCKIAFDWNTGKIDNGRIHSPEYFAYIQRTIGSVPRERGDFPCGEVNEYDIFMMCPPNYHNDIFKLYRLKNHVNNVILNRLPRNVDELNHRDLGLKYLMSEITEKNWRINIAKREKKRDKNSHLYDIFYTFTTIVNELLRNLINDNNTIEDKCKIFVNSVTNLIEYSNTEVKKINEIYKSKDKTYILTLE